MLMVTLKAEKFFEILSEYQALLYNPPKPPPPNCIIQISWDHCFYQTFTSLIFVSKVQFSSPLPIF